MQGFWILLLAVQILYSCAAITPPKTYHEERIYGELLSIRLSMETAKLHFTSVDETEQYVIWDKSHATKKGTVSGMSGDRNFIIRSVTFDDQGMYTAMNALNRKTSIFLLKVITKRSSKNCVTGENFRIPLAGLVRNDATLHFSNQDFNITLVDHGSLVANSHPEYMGRVQVTTNSIELLNVNVSDVGDYTLQDRLNRTVMVYSMYLVDHHQGITAGPLTALLMLLCIPPCICCCCRKKICKKSSQPTNTPAVKFDNQVNPPGPPPSYDSLPAPSGQALAYTPGYPEVGESTVYPPPNPTFPHQPPYSGYPATSPAMPPNPGFSPLVYDALAAPAGPEPVKGEITQATPLLTPEVAQNPAL